MGADVQLEENERDSRRPARLLAEGAFSRAAGAPLIEGNRVRLLKDAGENYPAWRHLDWICLSELKSLAASVEPASFSDHNAIWVRVRL